MVRAETIRSVVLGLASSLFLTGFASAGEIDGKGMSVDRALRAAMEGQVVRNVSVAGHTFHIQSLTVSPGRNRVAVSGLVCHKIKGEDTTARFTFRYQNGAEIDRRVEVKKGGVKVGYFVGPRVRLAGNWGPSLDTILDAIADKAFALEQ